MTFRTARRTTFCVIAVVLVAVIATSCRSSTGQWNLPTPTLAIEIGSKKRLAINTFVCPTLEDLEQLDKAANAPYEVPAAEILLAGQAFVLDEGTQVLILDWEESWLYGTGAVKIRALEGDFLGLAGWTYQNFIEGLTE